MHYVNYKRPQKANYIFSFLEKREFGTENRSILLGAEWKQDDQEGTQGKVMDLLHILTVVTVTQLDVFVKLRDL